MKNKLEELEKRAKEAIQDLEALTKEHDFYQLSDEEAKNFFSFENLPINSLDDSIRFQRRLPRNRFSMQMMKHRFALRKLCDLKQEELDKLNSDVRVYNIEILLEKINEI